MDDKNQTSNDNSNTSPIEPKPENTLEVGKEIKPQSESEINHSGSHAQKKAADNLAYDNDMASLNKTDIEEQTNEQPEKKRSIIKELLIWAGVTIAIVFIIQNFIFQAFYVSGSSMEPGFHDNDYLIISKIPLTMYDVGRFFGQKEVNIKRGDVLVFRYPKAPETFFIKRAIALPGERVTLKNGVVTIYNTEHPEGMVLNESYIDPQFTTQGDIDEIVEPGMVFVMGDNRSPGGSFDSREWGQLPQSNITGFASLRLLPVNTLKLVTDPSY